MYFCAYIHHTMSKRYTITAALPYTNGPLHRGHMAGVYVPADIYARYLRLKGHDVAFICGSDEHGVPITIKAKNEGVTPQDIVDHYNDSMGHWRPKHKLGTYVWTPHLAAAYVCIEELRKARMKRKGSFHIINIIKNCLQLIG